MHPWLCFQRGAFKTHQIITKTYETTNYEKWRETARQSETEMNCVVERYTIDTICLFINGVHYEFIFKTISLNSLKTIDCNQSIWLIVCNKILFCYHRTKLLCFFFQRSKYTFQDLWFYRETERIEMCAQFCVASGFFSVIYDHKNRCEMDCMADERHNDRHDMNLNYLHRYRICMQWHKFNMNQAKKMWVMRVIEVG